MRGTSSTKKDAIGCQYLISAVRVGFTLWGHITILGGTDIYLTKSFLNNKSLLYYPLKNPVLSFRTNHNMYGLDQEVSVLVNILGLNIKKLKVDFKNWHFYGSEQKNKSI